MTDSPIDIDKKSELNNLPRRYKKISITRYFIYLAKSIKLPILD